MRDLRELDKYRDVLQEHKLFGGSDDDLRKNGGCFWIPTKGSRKGLKVVASSGEIPVSQGWDHVSVSLPNRCPTWEEMCKVKDLFFYPHEVCFQLHPAQSDNISNHSFCLHIWRNIHQNIPLPPPEMVGIKDMGTFKPGAISLDTVSQIQDETLGKLNRKGFVEVSRASGIGRNIPIVKKT